jgi:hypothetical protein
MLAIVDGPPLEAGITWSGWNGSPGIAGRPQIAHTVDGSAFHRAISTSRAAA